MTFTGTLLPYQPEAVDRMVERRKMLVAYDLGLGKTVLTIAAIERLKDEGKITGPGLIICLSSLKYQWATQIEKFTDGSANVIVIDGTPKKREQQYLEAIDWGHTLVDYVILNYEQVVNDWDKVQQLNRSFVVVDEATAIKSFNVCILLPGVTAITVLAVAMGPTISRSLIGSKPLFGWFSLLNKLVPVAMIRILLVPVF